MAIFEVLEPNREFAKCYDNGIAVGHTYNSIDGHRIVVLIVYN